MKSPEFRKRNSDPPRGAEAPLLHHIKSSGVGEHGSVDDVGESTLQAAESPSAGVPGGAFAGEVVDGSGFVAGLGDRDRVERAVNAPVAASVQSVALVAA